MNNIRDLYNNAYEMFTPDFLNPNNMGKIDSYLAENSESLKNFILNYKTQFDLDFEFKSSNVLEIGSGIGSLSFFLDSQFHHVEAVDVSALAVANAKSIAAMKNSEIKFHLGDFCSNDFNLNKSFDFIVDSHLLHCITEEKSRNSYFNNIKKHLNPNGRIFIETMVFQPKMQFPIGYFYDENKTLWIDNEKENYPFRKILTSKEIEHSLLKHGLKIDFLFYHNELSFHPFDSKIGHPAAYCPKTLRICATLVDQSHLDLMHSK